MQGGDVRTDDVRDQRLRREGVVVPAGVVRQAEHVDVAVHAARRVRRVRAPDVQRDEPPGVGAVQLARHRVDVGGLPAAVPPATDLVGEVPRQDRRVRLQLRHRGADTPPRDRAHARRPFGPVARRVDRADALPDEDARRVEAVQQRRVERVLRARRVGMDALQPRHDAIHVRAGQRVTVARRVLLDRRAVQHEAPAVEEQRGSRAADLAQADAAVPRGLARDVELQVVELGVSGTPQGRVGDAHLCADRALVPGGDCHRREVEGGALVAADERTRRGDRARRAAIVDPHRHVDERRAAVLETRADHRRDDVARTRGPQRDRTVDAAEVEPRPVPARALHRDRVTPVGAHDERVPAPRRQRRANLERQVRADMPAHQPAVEPDGRPMVDGPELQHVRSVRRHDEVLAEPRHRAAKADQSAS